MKKIIQKNILSRPKRIFTIGILAVVFLSAGYVFQINKMTEAVYSLSEKEGQIENLLAETRDLNAEYGQQLSLYQIEQLAQIQDYHKIEEVTYIQLHDTTVARNTLLSGN